MKDRFKNINTINYILARAESEIFIATGLRKTIICVKRIEVPCDDVTPQEMLKVIAASVGMLYEDYSNDSRKSQYVHLRVLGAFFIRLYFPGLRLKSIGSLLDVDHTVVLHYLAVANNMILTAEPDFMPKYENALNALTQWLSGEE